MVGRDNALGTATRYELDGPEIDSRLGQEISHASRPAMRSTQSPVRVFPRGKAAGAWLWPPASI